MSKGKGLVGALALVLIIGACNAITGGDEPTRSTASSAAGGAASAAPTTTAAPVEAECHSRDTVYDGEDTCHPGGELALVRHVDDGRTLTLDDGRTVRLLGITAPAPADCAGPGATDYVRTLVEGEKVKLHTETGVDRDPDGRLLRYVQYATILNRNGLPIYAQDLGVDIVLHGWATPTTGDGAHPEYMTAVERAHDTAQYQPEGLYGPPCGKPLVYGDDDHNGVADWEEDVDVHVDGPDGNLPDGALTGGFCARKWYC